VTKNVVNVRDRQINALNVLAQMQRFMITVIVKQGFTLIMTKLNAFVLKIEAFFVRV
jgi:hypothetical protein